MIPSFPPLPLHSPIVFSCCQRGPPVGPRAVDSAPMPHGDAASSACASHAMILVGMVGPPEGGAGRGSLLLPGPPPQCLTRCHSSFAEINWVWRGGLAVGRYEAVVGVFVCYGGLLCRCEACQLRAVNPFNKVLQTLTMHVVWVQIFCIWRQCSGKMTYSHQVCSRLRFPLCVACECSEREVLILHLLPTHQHGVEKKSSNG